MSETITAIDEYEGKRDTWGHEAGFTITTTDQVITLAIDDESSCCESLDEGDVMFVDIETDRGVLQFVAYNAHNGYYGHEARVESKQLTHAETL